MRKSTDNACAWEQRKPGEVASSFEYGLNAAAKEFDGVNKYLRITDIDDQNTLGLPYEKYIQVTSQRSGQPGVNAQEYQALEMLKSGKQNTHSTTTAKGGSS